MHRQEGRIAKKPLEILRKIPGIEVEVRLPGELDIQKLEGKKE